MSTTTTTTATVTYTGPAERPFLIFVVPPRKMQTKTVDKSSGETSRQHQAPVSHGNMDNAVEALRRRYVQAELQLRECEDRCRRDCARQEQELELIQFDNNKLKAKIEEIRMAENAVQVPGQHLLPQGGAEKTGGDSKLLKASSRNYRVARETVERARKELSELEAHLASARVRLHDLRTRQGRSRSAVRDSTAMMARRRQNIEEQVNVSRTQLRGLEAHIDSESERLSRLLESAKSLRHQIDVHITMQSQMDGLWHDRELEMAEVMKETSFLIEVCNVLVEERNECQQQLIELRRVAEADADAYEKVFNELVSVEERSKSQKTVLREGIDKLMCEVAVVVKAREAIEREVLSKLDSAGDVQAEAAVVDDDSNGVRRQLREFEEFLEYLINIVGTDELSQVEKYVSEENDYRFKLFDVLQYTQNKVAALQKERDDLLEKLNTTIKGTTEERVARDSVRDLQNKLSHIESETQQFEEEARQTCQILLSALAVVEKILIGTGCRTASGFSSISSGVPTRRALGEYFATIEQQIEAYMALWTSQKGQYSSSHPNRLPERPTAAPKVVESLPRCASDDVTLGTNTPSDARYSHAHKQGLGAEAVRQTEHDRRSASVSASQLTIS
ncbi:hypothetical protein TRVL_04621 [Trypanosoma vivax]|uniref:ODAD1 central coiled coil region domain-containing protein n=1 Tax=Trypanosoma vivax (strain Y486) TaxID=1055687 RepID=G0TZ53_TRYVY|nr:hypothetical protein TRVL_04621 [Trypanosoma vivax]CCC49256.1 conserved hypothetical protein [Trypanosoma vivax Y486]